MIKFWSKADKSLGPDEPIAGDGLLLLGNLQLRNVYQEAEYRIVEIGGRNYLQCKKSDSFVFVESYDHGFDSYGKLSPGKWCRIGDLGFWEVCDFERLVRQIRGQQEPENIIKEL